MSSTYTVKSGDTLQRLAQRFLGSPSRADELYAYNRLRLRSAAELFPGEVLSIPRDKSDRIIKSEKIDSEQVILHLGGKQYFNFEFVQLLKQIDTVASVARLGIVLDSDAPFFVEPFKYELITISIGDDVAMTGRVEHLATDISPERGFLVIQGRALTGFLVDVSYPGRPYQFSNKTLESIARTVLSPFDIAPIFPEASGDVFVRIVMAQHESAFEFLSRLANMRGLLVHNDRLGRVIFEKANFSSAAVATIVEGEGVFDSASVVYDGTKRFSDVSADGQHRDTGSVRKTSTDTLLTQNKINRPLIIQPTNTPEGDLQAAVDWERGKRIAASTSIDVVVEGWRRPEDGELWTHNETVSATIPSCFIAKNTKLLIRSVLFKRDEAGTSTTLGLALPGSYSLVEDKGIPWQR